VESCTALVEHLDGRMEILRWRYPTRSEQLVNYDYKIYVPVTKWYMLCSS